jgi:hypothetical protein
MAIVATVEPIPVTTASLAASLSLDAQLFMSLPETVTLAWITVDAPGPLAPGELLRADVAIGTSRAGSILPLVGDWFGA